MTSTNTPPRIEGPPVFDIAHSSIGGTEILAWGCAGLFGMVDGWGHRDHLRGWGKSDGNQQVQDVTSL